MSSISQDLGLDSKNKVTLPWILKQKGIQKIAALTAYDYPTALFLDEAGVDILLVGDSLASVVYGEPNTLAITMDDMIRHTIPVARAARRAFVVGDMPFLSYQASLESAITNAGRFLKEGGAHSVKLEGGVEFAPTIHAITRAGIPVMGHIGLTPQTIFADGGYRMHGKTEAEKRYLLDSARRISEAGAYALVLECVEPELAQKISETIPIPTIGIGSGDACDGQILVVHDLIGLTAGRVPKFAKPVADFRELMKSAARTYVERTRNTRTEEAKTDGEKNALSH